MDPNVILVMNGTDKVNGNTTNVQTLIEHPGSDGISLREAIIAGNNTPGSKTITFSATLKGAEVQINEDAELLILTSDQFTIDGDIDGDGSPDITLNGSAGRQGTPSGIGLSIASSHNTVTGLVFKDFHGDASILFACPNLECANRTFTNNQIIGNTINSKDGSNGIKVSPLGLLLPEDLPKLNGIVWQDTLLQGNTITVNSETAIVLHAGVGGASGNRIANFAIINNQISGSTMGIAVLAADVASDYFGITDPINYSDENAIESLSIAGNNIENTEWGIILAASNEGDSNNFIQNTLIINNSIMAEIWGIDIASGGWGGSERSTTGNVIFNTTVKCNSIHEGRGGISVQSGPDPGNHFLTGTHDNRIAMLEISDNTILQYSSVAIQIIGGFERALGSDGSSNNIVDGVLITRNIIATNSSPAGTVGIEIIGGWGFSSLTEGNSATDISILNNSIQGNEVGISIIGGKGSFAQNGIVSISDITGNLVSENREAIRIVHDSEGATGNAVEVLGRIQ